LDLDYGVATQDVDDESIDGDLELVSVLGEPLFERRVERLLIEGADARAAGAVLFARTSSDSVHETTSPR
jgi:hypothetical protein